MMKLMVIDADNQRMIEEFDEAETQEVLERYKADGRWEDVSSDCDGDIILWEKL